MTKERTPAKHEMPPTTFELVLDGFSVPLETLRDVQYGTAVDRAIVLAKRAGKPVHVIGLTRLATCSPPS